ncbi:MAG: PKD domain-containing protein [Cyclobacteriaceae bacterium]
MVYDTANDSYHVFFVDNSLNTLKRLDLGDSLGTSFTEETINFTTGALLSPAGLEIVQDFDGNWYGFVASSQPGEGISRVDFGSSITSNDVSVTSLGTFGEGSIQIRGLKVIQNAGSNTLMGLNFDDNNIILAEYGNSLAQTPLDTVVTDEITGITGPRGFDIVRKNGDFIALVVGLTSSNIAKINFGDNLSDGFIIENIYENDDFSSDLGSLSDIFIQESFGNYYALIAQSNSGVTITLDLGDLTSSSQPVDLDYAMPELSAVAGSYFQGNYYFYGVGGRRLEYLRFTSECASDLPISTEMSPVLSFSEQGEVPVGLIAFHRSGTGSPTTDTITISSDIAPDIAILAGESRCVSSPVSFSSVNESGDIVSFAWDFDDDGIIDSNDPNPVFLYSSPGIYEVRLDIASGGCQNSVTTEITILPEPETASFEVAGMQFCTGDEISFINNSTETGLEDVISYLWSFDGEATSTDKNPTYIFNTAGSKEIGLQSVIPGCTTTVFTRQITVNTPPEVDFDFTRVCEGQPTEFFDISLSTDLVSYSWDFSDGFTSNIEDPQHTFASEGTYQVSFTATDANGCTNSVTKKVIVGQIPEPSFTITGDLACSGTALQFNDVTDNSAFNITSRSWQIDGEEVSGESNPVFTFANPGEYDITLSVANDFGCQATFDSTLTITTSPVALLEVQTACLGEPTRFFDRTAGEVQSWFWIIDGVEYTEQNPTVIFEESGTYEVSLEVTVANFCAATTQSTFVILAAPEPDFVSSSDCAREQIRFEDTSQVFEDEVVSRIWNFGDGTQANGEVTFHSYETPGEYEVTLMLITAKGCEIVYSEELVVNPTPLAGFEVIRDFGVPPFDIVATDLSENAVNVEWFLDGQFLAVDKVSNPRIPITEAGSFSLKQIVSNDFGCRDSLSMEIVSGIPSYDLILTDFEVIEREGNSTFVISVTNNSNLPVDNFDIDVALENEFIIRERYEGVLRQGDRIVYTLNSSVPSGDLGFVCISINPLGEEYPDVSVADNQDCRNLSDKVAVSDAHPNPSTTFAEIDVVLDQPQAFELLITDVSGNILKKVNFAESSAELQKVRIDLRNYRKGLYLIVFDFDGDKIVKRIIKN